MDKYGGKVKEKTMTSKKNFLEILVITLVFGFFLTGCDEFEDAYTFEFKVESYSYTLMGTITKVEFINGSNENAPILQTELVSISEGEMSGVYKVSGFTEKNGDDQHIYGVRVTFNNGENSHFNWGYAKNKAKIRVYSNSFMGLIFYDGNW
jgi:hypothetical protein